jgi:hypothetical protein
LLINLGEVEDKRFELFEPSGRVFKAPGTSLRLIKNVLDKVKRDLGNSPLRNGDVHTRSYLKNADHVQGQGAGRRKRAAYTGVCEHFEEVRNTVIGR